MKVKRGQRVVIKKPQNIHEPPTWYEGRGNRREMDIYDGLTVIVSCVYGEEFEIRNPPDGNYWIFSQKWAHEAERLPKGSCKCDWKHCRRHK